MAGKDQYAWGEIRTKISDDPAHYLAGATGMREVAKSLGVSRSALSRHTRAWGWGSTIVALQTRFGIAPKRQAGWRVVPPGKVLHLAMELQDVMAELDPITEHGAVEVEGPIAVVLAADMHLLSRWVDYEALAEMWDWMASADGLYIALFGDESEGFTQFYHSRPQMDQLLDPRLQRRVLYRMLAPVRDKVLWHCMGTAGHGTEQWLGEDLVRQWFVANGLPSFVGQGIFDVVVTGEDCRQTYRWLVAHDFPGHSYHNPLHAQGRALKEKCPTADVVASGHTHKAAIELMHHHEFAYRCGAMPIDRSWLVQIGTPKTENDPYTLTRWEHGVLFWPTFVMYPDRHEIKWVQSRDELRFYLSR